MACYTVVNSPDSVVKEVFGLLCTNLSVSPILILCLPPIDGKMVIHDYMNGFKVLQKKPTNNSV